MNLTALTLLGLATGLGQSPTPPAEPVAEVTSKKSFAIPVEVKPGRRAEIQSLQLWFSRDKGQLWEIMESRKADADSLVFKEKGDGPPYTRVKDQDVKCWDPAGTPVSPEDQKAKDKADDEDSDALIKKMQQESLEMLKRMQQQQKQQ